MSYYDVFALYSVSVINTAPSCGLPTQCRSGTKFPFARLPFHSSYCLGEELRDGRLFILWWRNHFDLERQIIKTKKKINYGVPNTWVMIPLISLLRCSHCVSSPCFTIFLSVMKIFYQDKSHVHYQNKTSYPKLYIYCWNIKFSAIAGKV